MNKINIHLISVKTLILSLTVTSIASILSHMWCADCSASSRYPRVKFWTLHELDMNSQVPSGFGQLRQAHRMHCDLNAICYHTYVTGSLSQVTRCTYNEYSGDAFMRSNPPTSCETSSRLVFSALQVLTWNVDGDSPSTKVKLLYKRMMIVHDAGKKEGLQKARARVNGNHYQDNASRCQDCILMQIKGATYIVYVIC